MRLFNTVMKSPTLQFLFIYKGNVSSTHNDYETHSDYIGHQNGALSYDVTAAILVF